MDSKNRKPGFVGRVGATLIGLFLAASLALAISAQDSPGRRRQALRESQLRTMDQFLQVYGSVDWSSVAAEVSSHPEAAENPRIMSVFLSLGNSFLNHYEIDHAAAELDRALAYFEAVAGNSALWGHRPLAGAVVVYLGISAVRLDSECDVGDAAGRIADFHVRVAEVAAAEADLIAPIEEYAVFADSTAEEDAARAALYATAAAFLPEDARSAEWAQDASIVMGRISSAGAETSAEASLALSQAELLYEAYGREVPRVLGRFAGPRNQVVGFRSSGGAQPASAAPIFEGGSLDNAIQDSRVLAALLTSYLRQFPAGSQCEISGGEIIRDPRY
ncbi:MAG TPA: hypothetical protein VGQ32_04935 [Thermoanaerobaculia bacterium]|jgi:hypothetical protein|nr:hypothetical protein [Thermoanaerobaculia bacterium]